VTAALSRALGVLAGTALLAAAGPALAQCSMCQQVVAASPEAQRLGGELNRAILVMLAAPYLVVTTFLLAFFRAPLAHRLRAAWRSRFPRPR
jgi:hypothetical protein